MGEVGKALKAFSPSKVKTWIAGAPKLYHGSREATQHLPETAHRKMAPDETDNTPVEGDTGLVDSGATHALRSRAEDEMQI